MKIVFEEDFKDLVLGEFPYDKNHSALGEYHHIKTDGVYGNWYDPICLHQWRSLDGSWLVASNDGKRFLEQNRGDNCNGAYKNVYCCLVNKNILYSNYNLEFEIRIFEVANYCGMAFNYLTSRCYDFVGIKGKELVVFHRDNDDFKILGKCEIDFDDLKTYHIFISIANNVNVYLNEELVLTVSCQFITGRKIACIAKSACRYSNVKVSMADIDYYKHLDFIEKEKERLQTKRKKIPKLECIKKLDLGNFGSGRQLRITRVDNKTIFVIAQHQKRMARDSFARISCLTCFDIDGKVLWQKGEANNSWDNTMISCDLPFQIVDFNGDGRLEILYSMDFYLILADLLSGKEIHRIPTPIVWGDPLVKNHPYYRLNVDAIRVADFEGLGYKGNFIIKDRYQNVWAYNSKFENIWRYNHKNTGHFPYIYDFDSDGKDEMFVGYDLVDHNGKIIFSLPMNSDHTDEIIYARLYKNEPKRLILASGNEGVNIFNIDGTIYKHNDIGHAQRVSVAKYREDIEGLQIMATAFWGGNGITCLYDGHGDLVEQFEDYENGNLITPVNYDGKNVLALFNNSLRDGYFDEVVLFPDDGHPNLCQEVFDIDGDGIDEIICFNQNEMWIYKASSFIQKDDYLRYPEDSFSNYRGEFLIPFDYN